MSDDALMLARALLDHYRCPEEFVRLGLAGELSADAGYFRFGPDTIGYGRTSSGTRSRQPEPGLHDVLAAVATDGGVVRLPFDPSEVVDNLRLERYAAESTGMAAAGPRSWQSAAYYGLRGLIPAGLRRALQRAYFRGWEARRFPRWPVDDTVERILERLVVLSLRSQGISRVPFVWFWPDGAPAAVILTHDVETAAGLAACRRLMDTDEAAGLRASFQLVPEARYEVAPELLEEIRRRGFEVNIHDLNHDGRLFSDREEFRRRAGWINTYAREFGARGFRSGVLYRRPEWYDALEIAYDMSVPNVGHLEVQRGGCCTVMPYFIGGIVELPLTTTQDYSLFHVLRDFAGETWRRQLDAIMARHGLASFLVHPDYLGTAGARHAYGAWLEHLARLRAAGRCWIPLPGEVERWWRARSRMTLVKDGDDWRVEGEGSERARVAYLELGEDDRLVHRVDPAPAERACARAA
jgi:hypothetical protein